MKTRKANKRKQDILKPMHILYMKCKERDFIETIYQYFDFIFASLILFFFVLYEDIAANHYP